jgi:hypothetical protein
MDKKTGAGRIIDGLVFHFGFSCESKGVMDKMGEDYRELTRRINENFSDELINEMLTLALTKPVNEGDTFTDRLVWDGKEKKLSHAPHSLNQRINELKK